LARRLALLGHAVTLLEGERFPRPRVGESLPPGILPLLDALGVRETVERAGFLRPNRAIVRWAEESDHWKSQPGEPGFQVDRGRLDQLLLEAAQEAGARVLQPVHAGRPVRDKAGWRVPVRGADVSGPLCARFVADASGRRRWLPGTVQRNSPPLLALYGYWRDAPLGGPETRVEAGEAAWYWGAPLPDGSVNATVFLDPERARSARPDLGGLYRKLLGQSTLLAPCLEGRLERGVLACDASALTSPDPVGEDWIRVGDAALALDPLSSQGVQTAIGSALQAAVVIHTLLTAPVHAEAALAFYRTHCRELSLRHQELSAAHYAERTARSGHPFWQRWENRTPSAVPSSSRTSQPPRPRPVSWDMRVALAPEAALRPTPCIVGSLVELRMVLHHPALARPVAYLNGVEIAPLLTELPGPLPLRTLLARWSATLRPSQACETLGWLLRMGILVERAAVV
jgi:flavin-dependent dehydrogenase